MDGKSIVIKHKSCHNAQELAKRIYKDLKQSKNYEDNLLEALKYMNSNGLSTYELEVLTGKRIELDYEGKYRLVQK